jgi:hypothetical protein
MRRTTGAQFLFLALTKAMKDFLQRLHKSSQVLSMGTPEQNLARLASQIDQVDQVNPSWKAQNSNVEAKILAYVTKALDATLELGC